MDCVPPPADPTPPSSASLPPDAFVAEPETWYVAVGSEVYGPVDVNTLRVWAAQGRLLPGWQARSVDGEAWFSPWAVPALADIPSPTPPAPRFGAIHLSETPDEAPPLGDVFSEAWDLLRRNVWLSAAVTLVEGLALLVPIALPAAVFLLKPWSKWPSQPWDARWLVYVACSIIYFWLCMPISIGVTTIFIDAARTGQVSFRGFWSGFRQWGSATVLMLVWFLVIQAPSFVLSCYSLLALAAMPVYTVIVWALADRQRGIIDAFAQIGRLLRQRYWWTLGLTLLAGIIGSAGFLALGVGLLVSLPFYSFITSLVYLHLVGRTGGTLADRRPPTGGRLALEVLPAGILLLSLLAWIVVLYLVMW